MVGNIVTCQICDGPMPNITSDVYSNSVPNVMLVSMHNLFTYLGTIWKVQQYDTIAVTAINGCCPNVIRSRAVSQECPGINPARAAKRRLCRVRHVQGIMNVPFNDFANTTKDGHRAVIAAFCLVSCFVDWANPSMFPSGWHNTRPQA